MPFARLLALFPGLGPGQTWGSFMPMTARCSIEYVPQTAPSALNIVLLAEIALGAAQNGPQEGALEGAGGASPLPPSEKASGAVMADTTTSAPRRDVSNQPHTLLPTICAVCKGVTVVRHTRMAV